MYDIDTSQFVGGTVETIRSRQSTDTAEAGNRIFVKVTPNKGYRNILVESPTLNSENSYSVVFFAIFIGSPSAVYSSPDFL